ncbi:MAG: cation diffusion facilitator family transporter [Alphaproteobacteria bacterium]
MTEQSPTEGMVQTDGMASAVTADKARLMRAAGIAAVCVAIILILVKFGALLLTGAVSMLATLVDSGMDLLASAVNLFAIGHALQPADREHRFGHGKAEAIAGLGQAAFITASASFVLMEAAKRIFHPAPIQDSDIGIGVMVLSIVITGALVIYQRSVIRRTQSVAVSADALHYLSDVLVNGSVIVAFVLTSTLGVLWIDPLFGAGIGCYVLYNAWLIVRTSLDQLMDRELPDPERDRIKEIVLAHPEVRAMHDLRTRAAGAHSFIQFHIELDGEIDLHRVHAISDEVEDRLRKAFPGAEIIVHQDPYGLLEEHPTFR